MKATYVKHLKWNLHLFKIGFIPLIGIKVSDRRLAIALNILMLIIIAVVTTVMVRK